MGVQGEYGDANESTIRMHQALRIMKVGSLIVDHVNKTDSRSKGGTATAYGSAYKMNTARSAWEVRKATTNGGVAINLYHAKSNVSRLLDPIGLNLDWEPKLIRFRWSGPVQADERRRRGRQQPEVSDQILELLEDGEHWELRAVAVDPVPTSMPTRSRGHCPGWSSAAWSTRMTPVATTGRSPTRSCVACRASVTSMRSGHFSGQS